MQRENVRNPLCAELPLLVLVPCHPLHEAGVGHPHDVLHPRLVFIEPARLKVAGALLLHRAEDGAGGAFGQLTRHQNRHSSLPNLKYFHKKNSLAVYTLP